MGICGHFLKKTQMNGTLYISEYALQCLVMNGDRVVHILTHLVDRIRQVRASDGQVL